MKTSRFVVLLSLGLGLVASGCDRRTQEDPKRLAQLQATFDRLHRELETAAGNDPAVTSALSADGQLLMGVRSELVERIAGNLSKRYLDTVQIDLGDVKGKSEGDLKKDTFLGNVKIGHWKVNVHLGGLIGRIRVNQPRVTLRAPDLVDVALPVDVEETEGDARLEFAWDSAALANVVCRDFEVSRSIRGRVIAQKHVIEGSLQLRNTGEDLIAIPLVPDRSVPLVLDLTPKSWEIVEAALREQNTFGRCGTLIKPAVILGLLRDLAKRGVNVKLPKSIFRTVKFPGRIEKTVRVHDGPVGIALQAESLRIVNATLWSSARVQVQSKAQTTTTPKP